MAHTNSIADRNTTMISMVRLAIIVLMAFRDLRFRLIVFFAHFTILIFLSHSSTAIGFYGRFQKPGSSNWASRLATSCPHLTKVKVNWLFLEVTTTTVYELPAT